jgi:hypothetical protein
MLVAAPGGVWNAELAKDRHETVHWIWDGILASGAMTLLAGAVRRKEMRPLANPRALDFCKGQVILQRPTAQAALAPA